MLYIDHNTDPPTAIVVRPAPHSTLVRGISVPPGGELPAGVYHDGGIDPVPPGKIITARRRVVRDGLSFEEHDLADAPDPQASKPLGLKRAENAFLATLTAAAAALGIDLASLPALTVSALTTAADASGEPEAKIAKWEARLLSRWMDVIYWAGVTQHVYDLLPSQPHQDV